MQWCNTLHKVTVSILFPHIINDQVWTFRACEIADLEIFKCDFKTTLNPQCKSLSLFSKPRGGRLIWSLKARHIKKTYSIGYSLLIGPWKKYQKTFLINDIRNWMFLSQRPFCFWDIIFWCNEIEEQSEIMKTQIQELPHMETIKNWKKY